MKPDHAMSSWKQKVISCSITIILGIVILMLSIYAVFHFKESRFLFSIIFFLGALMYFNSMNLEQKQKKKWKARACGAAALFFLLLALVSAIYLFLTAR